MASKRVLLTGVGGFIGAHCLEYFLEHTDWEIIGLDSFRNKGIWRRVESAVDNYYFDILTRYKGQEFLQRTGQCGDRVKIYRHDLSVPISQPLENLLLERKINDRGQVVEKRIDYIINMASDSAVERSTTDPTYCLRNNYDLAINMLELARRIKPAKFVQISTDEVYGEAGQNSPGHKEWDVILPSNPYAASKAAQEAVAIAYWRTYGVPVIITNTMNVIGEWQDPEKFLPKIIKKVTLNEEMPIYADVVTKEADLYHDGQNWKIGSRVYLDAKNKADALIFILGLPVATYDGGKGAKRPDRYNICGDSELNNLELAQRVAKLMGKKLNYKLIPSESARPGYDRRYALDGAKLRKLGWKPPFTLNQTLDRIVKHSSKHPEWLLERGDM